MNRIGSKGWKKVGQGKMTINKDKNKKVLNHFFGKERKHVEMGTDGKGECDTCDCPDGDGKTVLHRAAV